MWFSWKKTYAEEKPKRRKKNERNFNETVTGSRCTFRTPDKKMEPENGSLYLYREKMEVNYERYFNEAVIGSRCSFWTSDKKMEP